LAGGSRTPATTPWAHSRSRAGRSRASRSRARAVETDSRNRQVESPQLPLEPPRGQRSSLGAPAALITELLGADTLEGWRRIAPEALPSMDRHTRDQAVRTSR